MRCFFVRTVQRIINRVSIVERAENNYVLHFNNSNDQHFIWQHSPWSLEGALMAIDLWRPNTVLSLVSLPLIPIWVPL